MPVPGLDSQRTSVRERAWIDLGADPQRTSRRVGTGAGATLGSSPAREPPEGSMLVVMETPHTSRAGRIEVL